jgi:hypothetical protein
MRQKTLQCKHIDDLTLLMFIKELPAQGFGLGGTLFEGFENSVQNAMPADVPPKLARAKMKQLIKSGWVDGCLCGCRGDFELTLVGELLLNVWLKQHEENKAL